jgi:hypothetical protein
MESLPAEPAVKEAVVLAKCLNPACWAPFRYLHEGRVFNIELSSDGDDRNPVRKIEHFWLCAECATALKVVVENGGVTTRPLESSPAQNVAEQVLSGGEEKHPESALRTTISYPR